MAAMAELGLQFNFTGRKVLITGGANGIGRVTAKTFLKLGASVLVVDINQENLDTLKSEHPEITTICADISDWSGIEAVLAPHHPIHHLVNNAGIVGVQMSLSSVSEDLYDKIMDVNVKAVVRMSQLISKGMIDAMLEGATIVNMSSIESGKSSAVPDAMIYGASKAAVLAITRTMAHELAPNKIRVNAVRPAFVRTEIFDQMDQEIVHQIVKGPNSLVKRQIYNQDFLDPQRIANTVVYLSSPVSEMVTGTYITVDAGFELA